MKKILLFDEKDVCTTEHVADGDLISQISRVCRSREDIYEADVVAVITRDGDAKVMKSRGGLSGKTLPAEIFATRVVYGRI